MEMKPVQVFRAGAVSASVFMNERNVKGKKVSLPSVTIQKRFQDPSNTQWKSTSSFDAGDVLNVAFVTFKAYDFVIGRPFDGGESPTPTEDDVRED